jgi:hypothetical protein
VIGDAVMARLTELMLGLGEGVPREFFGASTDAPL